VSVLYVMNADGTDLFKLPIAAEHISTPVWSPDSQKLAFTGTLAFTGALVATLDIYVMNSDGTGRTHLTDTTANENRPIWSPDGRKIAFEAANVGVCVLVPTAPTVAASLRMW
jgi:TolB protein